MIVVPLFDNLRVKDYGLFPGANNSYDVVLDFSKGLSVIAGVNGLGKTTLLQMLLRELSGPYDITGVGPPNSYEAILPEKPVQLRREGLSYFSQRVADGAENAIATLYLSFKDTQVSIGRNLANLDLISFEVSGEQIELPENRESKETLFQEKITSLFNLASFVDVLLVLHNLVFLTERREGALWDPNAQRHLLGAVFLDKDLAKSTAHAARSVVSLDSQFRSTRQQHTKFSKQLDEALIREEASPQVKAQLEATESALSGSVEQLMQLEEEFEELKENQRELRLVLEKAKLENESASGAVERAKYSSLMHIFPKMEDSAKLLISRILSEAECLVCGAEASAKKLELEELLIKGFCPACGADPESQTEKAPAEKFEKAKMGKARKSAALAASELKKAHAQYDTVMKKCDETLTSILSLKTDVGGLSGTKDQLSALLPDDSDYVKTLRKTVGGLSSAMNSERANLENARDEFSIELASARVKIVDASFNLSNKFSSYIKKMLVEDASLNQQKGMARVGQMGDLFEFPTFVAEMAAADRPGLTPRIRPNDVSESQRELIDLAFRLALTEVATETGHATFIMETPEASLDGIAMARVGAALKEFYKQKDNCLIVTNNLTNAGMISSLFGGKASSDTEKNSRFETVFNLLDHAAPNRAVLNSGNEYRLLLQESIVGESLDGKRG
ncbi:MAG: AAA family ATPase [Cytophagales bacterium]|nr:AAA family ATPase [Cytophagales bacterium]